MPGQGGVFNPINLSNYSYAANNPLKYKDPTGRSNESNVKDLVNNFLNDPSIKENMIKYFKDNAKEIYDYIKKNGITNIEQFGKEKIIALAQGFANATNLSGNLAMITGGSGLIDDELIFDLTVSISINAVTGFIGGFVEGLLLGATAGAILSSFIGQTDGPAGEIGAGLTAGIVCGLQGMGMGILSGAIQGISMYGHSAFGWVDVFDSTLVQAGFSGLIGLTGGPSSAIRSAIAAGLGDFIARQIILGETKWLPGN